MTMVAITIRVPAAMYQAVLEASDKDGVSVSEWVRTAVEDQLTERGLMP